MAVEVDKLYSDLNKLLFDICQFLRDGSNYDNLSPQSRKQADELLRRSKKQLQEIAKISIENDYDAYVDMERKSGFIVESNNEEDKNNIYSSVEETTVITPPPNPYMNLPAKDLCRNLKYGTLSWKCKIILKFEKVRRIFAGVHNDWLLIYSSEKDYKPLQTFNLKFHKAQVVTAKQKGHPLDFELIYTMGEGKSYYFIASTHKDMLQWTSHINRCHDKLHNPENTTISDDDISETYDMIAEVNTEKNVEEEEEEDIYHDIELYTPEVNVEKPPDLPARRYIEKPTLPLPPLPQKQEEDDDSSESSRDSLDSNSFSEEDEEDAIYAPFVSKPVEKKPTTETNNEVYENKASIVEKPKTPTKPKILTEKPKHFGTLRK